ncbi:alpha-amylase family glycosyl hydrolase [Polyangium sorediatum]|uniref:Alpha-amylase family glycosyl hydrolase n=1 Tax=Polyangium sorediatum TaxID=889274 RepID=A0ABT6P6P6_9BACT|nr:alpha-amylase family glycosyl hydrolase [Polyangium sorediatum]MDI1435977.1 alpha-amylase family glycosyl hydrolase [Polyangium sorediatum]
MILGDTSVHSPALYEIFARMWLYDLGRVKGARVTLADVPDEELDRLARLGFDYVYLMGVWTLGEVGPKIAREMPSLRAEYERALPDLGQADVIGSPFAVARYAVDPSLGGDAALAVLREKLRARGIGLLLDFVPNHLARDHHWITERPELFVREANGQIACGKDPYFPPWTDTAQLDFRAAETRQASIEALLDVASRCDGVRCDMAMLVLSDVFQRTWAHARRAEETREAEGEFWAEAIDAVRERYPTFVLLAEAYWDLEWRLQTLGFDYTYDKSMYDRLLHGSARAVRGHLSGSFDYQARSARFLENHDEPRIASALPPDRRKAATVLLGTTPGMRFFHDGQLEGRKIRAPVQLARRADERVDEASLAFHHALLDAMKLDVLRRGRFALLSPRAAGPGSTSFESFVAYRWDARASAVVVVVNLGPARGHCTLTLDLAGIAGRNVRLVDRIGGEEYRRSGDELLDDRRGLYVELPAYGAHLFEVKKGNR